MINTIENQIKELENQVFDLVTFRDSYLIDYRDMINDNPKLYNVWIATGAAIMSLQQAIKDLTSEVDKVNQS